MKTRRNTFISLLCLSGLLTISGCVKQDFDTPPVIIPHVNFTSNTTIAQLKAMHTPGALDSIADDIIIQGIIVATDESGNLYKTLELKDNTGGIELKIDQTSLYTTYHLGQRVFIKCKGLFLGDYGGLTQLGYIYNGGIGQLPAIYLKDHYFLDSLPGPAPVAKVVTIPQVSVNDLSTLIQLDSVHFPDAGAVFAPQTASATNRNVVDDDGNTIILRTSKYANFAGSPLPKGKGSIRAILTIFNGEYQLVVRDINDLFAFDTNAPVQSNIIEENFDADPANWVKYSVASNKNWTWSSTYLAETINGYGGDVASNDWLITPAINLTNVTSPVLSFKTWTKYTDNGLANPMEVLISTNYSGSEDPTGATWTALPCTLPAANSASWTGSGDVDLSAYHQTVYIAFHYRCSGVTSSTASSWEVDTFKITGNTK